MNGVKKTPTGGYQIRKKVTRENRTQTKPASFEKGKKKDAGWGKGAETQRVEMTESNSAFDTRLNVPTARPENIEILKLKILSS